MYDIYVHPMFICVIYIYIYANLMYCISLGMADQNKSYYYIFIYSTSIDLNQTIIQVPLKVSYFFIEDDYNESFPLVPPMRKRRMAFPANSGKNWLRHKKVKQQDLAFYVVNNQNLMIGVSEMSSSFFAPYFFRLTFFLLNFISKYGNPLLIPFCKPFFLLLLLLSNHILLLYHFFLFLRFLLSIDIYKTSFFFSTAALFFFFFSFSSFSCSSSCSSSCSP